MIGTHSKTPPPVTEASDIYSFAMTMYEALSGGEDPFTIPPIQSDIKGLKKLVHDEKKRPVRPDDAPAVIWSVVESCWIHEPELRITFAMVASKLRAAVTSSSKFHYASLPTLPQSNLSPATSVSSSEGDPDEILLNPNNLREKPRRRSSPNTMTVPSRYPELQPLSESETLGNEHYTRPDTRRQSSPNLTRHNRTQSEPIAMNQNPTMTLNGRSLISRSSERSPDASVQRSSTSSTAESSAFMKPGNEMTPINGSRRPSNANTGSSVLVDGSIVHNNNNYSNGINNNNNSNHNSLSRRGSTTDAPNQPNISTIEGFDSHRRRLSGYEASLVPQNSMEITPSQPEPMKRRTSLTLGTNLDTRGMVGKIMSPFDGISHANEKNQMSSTSSLSNEFNRTSQSRRSSITINPNTLPSYISDLRAGPNIPLMSPASLEFPARSENNSTSSDVMSLASSVSSTFKPLQRASTVSSHPGRHPHTLTSRSMTETSIPISLIGIESDFSQQNGSMASFSSMQSIISTEALLASLAEQNIEASTFWSDNFRDETVVEYNNLMSLLKIAAKEQIDHFEENLQPHLDPYKKGMVNLNTFCTVFSRANNILQTIKSFDMVSDFFSFSLFFLL